MNELMWYSPTRIVFGNGSIQTLDRVLPNGIKHAMIVTGRTSAKAHGYLQFVQKLLQDQGVASTHFGEISANPKTAEIDQAVEVIRQNSIDAVIGLGGGSVLDAAKVISVMPYVDKPAKSVLIGETKLGDRRLPLILIPTTAGTGSELSKGAIISDSELKIKQGVRGDILFADVALVDPELTRSLPLHLMMETGFDVLTHAIETYFSLQANKITETFSLETVKAILPNLPELKVNPDNSKARIKQAYYSMLMGMNLANSSTCLPHRMQYPVGAVTETSHPRGLAALYPSWLRHSMQHNMDKFKRLAKHAGFDNPEAFYSHFEHFLDTIGMNLRLGDLGIRADDISLLIGKISGSVTNDPVAIDQDALKRIYQESL